MKWLTFMKKKKELNMKMRPLVFIIGILLVVFGVYTLAYDYIPPHRERHAVDVGPVHFGEVVTEEKTSPAPLIIGILAMAAGLVLIFGTARKS
jgi:uncharacterized membrane protein HdeD (DUF308 family)